MALHKLFLESNVENERVGNSMSTTYTFDGNSLVIYWRDQEVYKRPAKLGDAYAVGCNGGADISVSPLRLPNGKEATIMWLCDFPKLNRAFTDNEYQRILEQERQSKHWWGYRERSRSGNGWAFTICNRPDCGGWYPLVMYIERGTTNETLMGV